MQRRASQCQEVEGSVRQTTLDVLLCPVCGQDKLTFQGEQTERFQYPQGMVDEIRSGQIACPDCGVTFPIEDYVLSLIDLLPDDVRHDGEYWGQYYNWYYERQGYGYFDLQQPTVPFVAYGVAEPIPFDGEERGGMHTILADHPLIRNTHRALDIGCGVGWTTLYLARQGFDMVGLDPALQSVKLAKRYALQKQVPVDYIAGGLGYVRFRLASFDTVFGFHFRFVVLDGLADMIYLKNDRSIESLRHASDVVGVLNNVLKRSFPEAVEYVTVVGQKQRSLPAVPQPGLDAVYSKYGALFEHPTSEPRRHPRAQPTPWWKLPSKAWRMLCYEGLVPLLAEFQSYLRWKRAGGR
jgi:SAM-dependent methyltransferase